METLPKIKTKKFDCTYGLMMTAEMKQKLTELREFHEIDVSEVIRRLIENFLFEFEKKRGE